MTFDPIKKLGGILGGRKEQTELSRAELEAQAILGEKLANLQSHPDYAIITGVINDMRVACFRAIENPKATAEQLKEVSLEAATLAKFERLLFGIRDIGAEARKKLSKTKEKS